MKYLFTKLYVAYQPYSLENEVFTSIEEATEETNRLNKILEEHYPNAQKYETITLEDAIWKYLQYLENR